MSHYSTGTFHSRKKALCVCSTLKLNFYPFFPSVEMVKTKQNHCYRSLYISYNSSTHNVRHVNLHATAVVPTTLNYLKWLLEFFVIHANSWRTNLRPATQDARGKFFMGMRIFVVFRVYYTVQNTGTILHHYTVSQPKECDLNAM